MCEIRGKVGKGQVERASTQEAQTVFEWRVEVKKLGLMQKP